MNGERFVFSSRIPEKYIVVKGAGQSSFGPGVDPWETAAYDLALLDAGIANCNIVKYTSVMPPEAEEITYKDAVEQGLFHHGMVLESIMAQVDGNQGQHLCAGVGRAKVFCESANGMVFIGGFAAEYEGYGSTTLAEKKIREALEGIFNRRYKKCGGEKCIMQDIEITTQDLVVDEQYGTVLVGVCFLTFLNKVVGHLIPMPPVGRKG